MENYKGTDDGQYFYIRGTWSYVRCTKQGRKTCALWGISLYHKMCNV